MVEQRSQSKARVVFATGWVLNVLNLAAIAFSAYVPIYTRTAPDRPFFFYDKQVPLLFAYCMILIGYSCFALLQVALTTRWMYATVADSPESAAAEASMRVSRILAVATSTICFLSFIVSVRDYRLWSAILDSLRH